MSKDMDKRLKQILTYFPLPKPSRIVESEDGMIVAEWQWDEKYFEIEIIDDQIEVMARVDAIFKHWVIRQNLP